MQVDPALLEAAPLLALPFLPSVRGRGSTAAAPPSGTSAKVVAELPDRHLDLPTESIRALKMPMLARMDGEFAEEPRWGRREEVAT